MIVGVHEEEERARRISMNIETDLLERAKKLTGLSTKRETVEEGLKLLIRITEQQAIRRARGRYQWQGDLDQMRRAR